MVIKYHRIGDSMIGKLIVHAKDRGRAINRMQRALEETIIEGVKTTIPISKNNGR